MTETLLLVLGSLTLGSVLAIWIVPSVPGGSPLVTLAVSGLAMAGVAVFVLNILFAYKGASYVGFPDDWVAFAIVAGAMSGLFQGGLLVGAGVLIAVLAGRRS